MIAACEGTEKSPQGNPRGRLKLSRVLGKAFPVIIAFVSVAIAARDFLEFPTQKEYGTRL
jgi:hypothetical protein